MALEAGTGGPVPEDVQQYACGFRIANTSTGAGCTGCLNGVILALTRVTLTQPGVPTIDLTTPVIGNAIVWQEGIPPATRDETWGAVKALYRN